MRAWNRLPNARFREVFELQRKSYTIESRLLRYERLPPLTETIADFLELRDQWLLYYLDGKVIGALAYEVRRRVEISRLFVSPLFFRKGVGMSLVENLMKRYPRKSFLVATGEKNRPAIKLYQKCGFVTADELVTEDGLVILKMVACPLG